MGRTTTKDSGTDDGAGADSTKVHTHFRPADAESEAEMERMFATFKRIIKLRQERAHAVKEDVFDQAYFRQQREL